MRTAKSSIPQLKFFIHLGDALLINGLHYYVVSCIINLQGNQKRGGSPSFRRV